MSECWKVDFHTTPQTEVRVQVCEAEDGHSFAFLRIGDLMRGLTIFLTPEFAERLAEVSREAMGITAGLALREVVETEMDEEGSCP